MTALGLVSRASPVQTTVRNCTRDEGGPFEVDNQVLIMSYQWYGQWKSILLPIEGAGQLRCLPIVHVKISSSSLCQFQELSNHW